VDKFSHQPRLYHWAVKVGAGFNYDDDVLFAATWLHDLGVFIGHRPEEPEALAAWDHVAYVVRKAPEILRQSGFPPEKIPAVLAAIQSHLPRNAPLNLEGEILRDADILEQLGAIGVARMLSKVGRDTRYRTYSDAMAALRRNLQDLPGQIRLRAARQLAKDRIRLLRDFLAAAETEADGQPL
jgi:uncharacterized protein